MAQASVGRPPVQPTVIYLDVTELVVLDLRTGIQRVVREILEHGAKGAAAVPVVPVVAVEGRFHGLSDAGWQRINAPGSGATERRITHERGVSPLIRVVKRAVKINAWLYNRLQRFHVQRVIRNRSRGLYTTEPVQMGADASLVLLDSFWGGSSTLAATRNAREQGAKIILVVHDLIPMSHPQYCDYRLVQKFAPMMRRAVALSDHILANSQFTADEFNRVFPDRVITPIPLGHDIREVASVSPDQWPCGLWGDPPVFLIVGSIEPRKGHECVLDAFERRWARGEQDKLLILGKIGWQVESLMARIDQHPEAGKRLFHVFHATDAMLKDAFSRATGGIIASFIEGFGLPLVEILASGLPAIASDIPVFHEIAGDSAIYFTAGDSVALDNAVEALHRRYPERLKRAVEFSWPDWKNAATTFFTEVEQVGSPS